MFKSQLTNLSQSDAEIFELIQSEYKRQEEGLELIASENYTSRAVMEAQGSVLTNKYAEGLPKKRYYGGCEFVDEIETLAINRLTKLFNAKYANVQPHSGSQANMGAYFSFFDPKTISASGSASGSAAIPKILGMNLAEGGHLTHGSPVNFSGKLFSFSAYGLNHETEKLDYNQIREIAKKERPQLIVTGASSYPRMIDFKIFREIADEVGAFLMADMAHIAGLVATGLHNDPLPYAHITTSTTHKTLRGPRGGVILTNDDELAKKMNSQIFPGIQGGPLEHVIAAKAVAFKEALDPKFKEYQLQVIENAQTLAKYLMGHEIELVSHGTDNHLLLVKTDSVGLSGKEAEAALEKAGITCNKNMIPRDTRSPFITSGIRLGTPAITTRGFKSAEVIVMGEFIVQALKNSRDENHLQDIRKEVLSLCRKYPVYRKNHQ